MENVENGGLSLREAIEAGFERVSAEENAGNDVSAAETMAETGAESVAETSDNTAESQQNQFNISGIAPEQAQNEVPNATQQPQNEGNMLATALEMIRSMRAEIERLNQINKDQGVAMNQQSQAAENAIEESVMTPQIPQLDFSQLAYMGDEERASAMSAWQNAIMENAVARVRAEFAPVKADYEQKSRAAAEASARNAIFSDPRFSDFASNQAEIERIAQSPVFKDISPEQRYLYSGLISRGMRHDPAAKPTTDQIVQMVMSNPDALKAIETRRAQEIRNKNAELPILAGSSGMSGANPIPENRVKTKEELESRVNMRFGL